MTNEIQIFNNPEFGEIRSLLIDNEPWFVAVDVCKALEIGNNRMAVNRLDDDEKMTVSLTDGHSEQRGGAQSITVVNESGLYSLVLGSRKPEAKSFKRWITHEVIPSIRKHGAYMTPETLQAAILNPDYLLQVVTALKKETDKRKALENETAQQRQLIAEFSPKASYYDVVLQTKDVIAIGKIAKDYGKSAQWLNRLLHEKGVQFKQGGMWLLYQKYAKLGYTKSKTETFSGDDGRQHSRIHTYWTQKGRLFIYDLLKADGILPLIDQPN